MAGDMHRPTFDHPHCWTDPREPGNHPAELTPRQSWCWDAAAACGDAKTPWHREVQTAHTPGCRGCSRRIRSFLIERGKLKPHPSVKTGPLRDGVRASV